MDKVRKPNISDSNIWCGVQWSLKMLQYEIKKSMMTVFLDKDRTMEDVQKDNICTNVRIMVTNF
jgi:hypothetical protein